MFNSTVSRTNVSDQFPPNDINTIEQVNSKFFSLLMNNTSLAKMNCNQVIVKTENRGDEGSKKFDSNYMSAAEALML